MRSAALLALTGGGIMARFTTAVLEDLQLRRDAITGGQGAEAPLPEVFDLMAGTSAGALCVAGLAMGRSPAELSRLFDEHGPRIFPAGSFWRLLRWTVTAKFDQRPLQAAVDVALGGTNPRLGDLSCHVAFPAVDETEGQPVVFTTANPDHLDIPLRDVVLASAAAPTYFPAHRIGPSGRRFVDGGLFANAPDLAALTIARKLWPHIRLEDIHLVSIGTTNASSRSPYGPGHPGAKGLVSWAAKPPARILKLAMRAQVDHAMALLPELQLAEFLRIDARLDEAGGRSLDLDNASPIAMSALRRAGREALSSFAGEDIARLGMILGRRRAPTLETSRLDRTQIPASEA